MPKRNYTVQLSHDAFARFTIVRETVHTNDKCHLCNQNDKGRLFNYGTNRDDRNRNEWEKQMFCSKSCHDQYWGQ